MGGILKLILIAISYVLVSFCYGDFCTDIFRDNIDHLSTGEILSLLNVHYEHEGNHLIIEPIKGVSGANDAAHEVLRVYNKRILLMGNATCESPEGGDSLLVIYWTKLFLVLSRKLAPADFNAILRMEMKRQSNQIADGGQF